jgi:hypothetical protein
MKWVARCSWVLAAVAVFASGGQAAVLPPGASVVYGISERGEGAPVTALYVQEVASGSRREIYRDHGEANRILIKIASSGILGAGRAAPPGEVYFLMGPTRVSDLRACTDALCRLEIRAEGEPMAPERLFPVPFCFSDASPYGLWNRAPNFAVSADGRRFAVPAMRVGETRLERTSIRVLSATGEEVWRIPLEDEMLYVADLAWSPNGDQLAYIVMPYSDEHTLDEALLPKAGVYLADVEGRTTRLLYQCFASTLAWGPGSEEITVAAHMGDVWSTECEGHVIVVPSGEKRRQFSLRGYVTALAYSEEATHLAAQARYENEDRIWIYPTAGGWGEPLRMEIPEGGVLALLGWARLGEGASGP